MIIKAITLREAITFFCALVIGIGHLTRHNALFECFCNHPREPAEELHHIFTYINAVLME